MATDDSVMLVQSTRKINSKDFGSAASGRVQTLTYGCINKDKLYVPAHDNNKLLTRFKTLISGQNIYWISFFWEKKTQEIGFYARPDERFMQSMCRIFPNVAMDLRWNIKASLSDNPTPYYSHSADEQIYFMDVLFSAKQSGTPTPAYNQFGIVVPLKVLEPLQITILIWEVDIAFTWSEHSTIPFVWTAIDGGTIQHNSDIIIQELFENDLSKDFTIVAANGAEIKCHSSVLEVHSSVLTAMVSPTNGMKESTTHRIEMKDADEEAVKQFVSYTYGRKVPISNLSAHVALQLFQIAHKYEVAYLTQSIALLLLRKGVGWFSPDTTLELYYFVRYLKPFSKLREHSLRMMLRISKELRACERYQELSAEEKEALQWKLVDLK